jgi:hypothetical protein
MKILKAMTLLLLIASLYSCGDGCKMCEFQGDPIGEYCDDQLKSIQSDGAKCR